MSYANIVSRYLAPSARQWDASASMPYLSFTSPHAPDGCTYVSYDDDESVRAKAAYVTAQGLGAIIIWTINQGHLPSTPHDPLLGAIADAL